MHLFSTVTLLLLPYYLLTITITITECAPVSSGPSLPWRHLSYNETVVYLNALRGNHSDLVQLLSIGKSVQGRDLWVVRLSTDTVPTSVAIADDGIASGTIDYYLHNRTLLRPTIRLVGAIHGDEPLGTHLLLKLAQHLVTGYRTDDRIARLLNSTDIELLPLANPDGFAVAKEGDCLGVRQQHLWNGRENAKHTDLDENFVANFDNNEARSKLEPETLAVMTWMVSNPSFVLSASIHTGSVVVSYPWDGQTGLTADNALFKKLATDYVLGYTNSSYFTVGCQPNEEFADGTVLGHQWSLKKDSMADFSYLNTNCMEISLYLSCCKYANSSTLETEWNNNKLSLLQFIESAHFGVKGLVLDADSKLPIKGAVISISTINHSVISSDKGEYWRILLPGTYSITASAYGYENVTKSILVTDSNRFEAQQINFELAPHPPVDPTTHETENNEDFPEFRSPLPEFVHHNYVEMEKVLKSLAAAHPSITRLYSAGESVERRQLWVLEISDNPGLHEFGEPEFKYVANMHGNEVVGREMLLLLARLLLDNYGRNANLTALVNNTRLHLMPSMNPDGWERATEGDCDSLLGRGNAHDVDLNRNFPDQYRTYRENAVQEPETVNMMEWLRAYPFVLSANLHGGSLVANYPFDGNNRTDGADGYSATPDDRLFRHLAKVYSQAHPYMHLGECHEKCSHEMNLLNEHFPDGIINGAQWYALYGGMQDWNYLHTNCFEITVEMGCRKYPWAKELSGLWRDNRRPLLAFLHQVHRGVKGVVRDSITNMSIADAVVSVNGSEHTVRSVAPYGDFWRLLLPGTYIVTVAKPGYGSVTKTVTVGHSQPVWIEYTLARNSGVFMSSSGGGSVLPLPLLCLLIVVLIFACTVVVCCPGLVQQLQYMIGRKRKGRVGLFGCCGGGTGGGGGVRDTDTSSHHHRKRPDSDSFHYTKLSENEINLDSDDDEDMAFDVNHLLRK